MSNHSTEKLPTRTIILCPFIYERQNDHKRRLLPKFVENLEITEDLNDEDLSIIETDSGHKKKANEYKEKEAIALARAIDLKVVDSFLFELKKLSPGTLIGKGKLEELKNFIKESEIELAIVDFKLSPIQQRNLEKAWNIKVIDRTALIIEIFGKRARTREGMLQVELASLEYQKGRLVRSWTHLERQRGGFGFLGGPGEKQIESDRRLIGDKIDKIKLELAKVKRTRALHRKSRSKVPYPVIALVGYTNAGKSTLFNQLTGANEYAEDKLFATLDPKMRIITLPSRRKVILSDTVGFISNLPTELIAAFRATLEEVIEANIILHVEDIASEEAAIQKSEVERILVSLGIENKDDIIEVLNKADLLDEIPERGISISALTGANCDKLLKIIDEHLKSDHEIIEFNVTASNGKLIAWIYENSLVLKSEIIDEEMKFTLQISEKNKNILETFL